MHRTDLPAPDHLPVDDRSLLRSVGRGLRLRCPNCGEGPVLHSYLKIRPECPACGQDLSAARADDGPAYLTILLVGHILAPIIHFTFGRFRPEPLQMALALSALALALSLFLLPRMKGAMIGFQWARGLGGFGHDG